MEWFPLFAKRKEFNMGNFYMESTQINYRRDEKLKTVDQKLQELSETSAIDTDIAPVFKSTNTYQPGDMVYYRNKLYVFNVEHTGTWAAADVTATDVTTELNSLKSGLTNYQTQNDINLEVPNRKNILPMVASNIKSINISGTWSGNSYTINGVTYIINTDASGNITSISVYGSRTDSSATTRLILANNLVTADYAGKLLSGCPNIGGENYGELFAQAVGGSYSVLADDFGDTTGVSISASSYPMRVCISVGTSFNVSESDAVAFYPMIRPATITDPTFAPYIPSVESRIEAVESGVTGLIGNVTFEPYQAPGSNPFAEDGSGYLLKVTYKSTLLGYLVIRPRGYANPAGRKIAIELFDSGWHGVWEIHRDYPE